MTTATIQATRARTTRTKPSAAKTISPLARFRRPHHRCASCGSTIRRVLRANDNGPDGFGR